MSNSVCGKKDSLMAIRYKCVNCNIVLSGEGASRHYLANPTHKLEKLPPPPKPVKNPTR